MQYVLIKWIDIKYIDLINNKIFPTLNGPLPKGKLAIKVGGRPPHGPRKGPDRAKERGARAKVASCTNPLPFVPPYLATTLSPSFSPIYSGHVEGGEDVHNTIPKPPLPRGCFSPSSFLSRVWFLEELCTKGVNWT
jgi:hypothetical protein